MGFLGNVLSGGKGIAGANNAQLAELAIRKLGPEQKLVVAAKVVEMGMMASRGRFNPDSFVKFFNDCERVQQLNAIALALWHLEVPPPLPGEQWMTLANPFAVPTDRKDLDANASHLRRKHSVAFRLPSESIDLHAWGI
jgi:hypothetical protein